MRNGDAKKRKQGRESGAFIAEAPKEQRPRAVDEKRDTGHLNTANEGRSKDVLQALHCVRILDSAACVFRNFREVDAGTGLRSAVAIDRGDLRIRVGADHAATALYSRILGTKREGQARVIYVSI